MKTNNAIVAAVTAMFCMTMVAVVLVAVLVPGDRATTLITGLVGMLAPTVAAVITLGKVGRVEGQVGRVEGQVHDLSNGLMDAKIRAGVADVLHPDLVDEEARPLIAQDRERRGQPPAKEF